MKVALTVFCLIFGTIVFADEATEFSNPPSNLPIKKIYVHGRPVYVRQSFVNPIRYLHGSGVQQQPFAGGYANNPNPPVAPQGYESNIPAYSQQQPYAPAPPAPAPPPPPQPQFQNLPVNDGGDSGNLPEGFQSGQLPEAPAPTPAPPPPPPPPPPPADVPPPPPPAPKFPLPECYTNKNGFMCCSKGLEDTINEAYDELKNSKEGKWSSCNIQQIANRVQQLAEKRFNTTFEAMAGISDYASKSNFYHNYICKVERDNRYILAYASPRTTRLPGDDFLHGSGQEGDNGPQPAPYKAHHHTFTWRV
uniref:Ground-like domain-containing protein n=1 Tax=Panagrolaimus sp. ES5 TaxID=591445 RepID=A0AC34GVK8_9BILA